MFKFKTKEEVDTDLKIYYDEQKAEIDADLELEIEEAREKLETETLKKKLELEIEGARQMKDYEHVWHSSMEERKVEIAKLDAEILAKKQFLTDLLAEKDRTIKTLTLTIEMLTKNNTLTKDNP